MHKKTNFAFSFPVTLIDVLWSVMHTHMILIWKLLHHSLVKTGKPEYGLD